MTGVGRERVAQFGLNVTFGQWAARLPSGAKMPDNADMSESESEAETLERLEAALASIAARRDAAHRRPESAEIVAALDQVIAKLRDALAEIDRDDRDRDREEEE